MGKREGALQEALLSFGRNLCKIDTDPFNLLQ